MRYSTVAKQSTALLGVLLILITVVAAGFAGSTAGSTNSVQSASTNPISSANITYATHPDEFGGTYFANITFKKNITQNGTPGEVMNAFDIGQDKAKLVYNDDNLESNVTVDEANDRITFTITENNNINSSTNFSENSNNGLQYNGSAGGDPINTNGTAMSDFNETLNNNIVPIIDLKPAFYKPSSTPTGVPAHLTVTNNKTSMDPNQIFIQYSEKYLDFGQNTSDAFNFTGDNAPNITRVTFNSTQNSLVGLRFQNDVEAGDDLGKLTYDGSDNLSSPASGKAAQNTSESDLNLTVRNEVIAPPEIQRVIFDDVPENNDDDTKGEMLLYFDSNINAQRDGGDNTSGLSFNSDSTNVSIDVDGGITDDYPEQPDNVIAVNFSNASSTVPGAVQSLVREGDTFGSDATLSVNTSNGLDITYNGTGGDIASTNVQAENISNEIAGNLSEVNETSSDIEILGAEVDEQGGTYNVTVSGLSDGENQVLDENISVSVAGTSNETSASTVKSEFRFDNEHTFSLPANGSVNSSIGETVPINVTNQNGTEVRPNTAATVKIAHEARVTSSSTSGTFIISMPQPGEIVAGSDIGAINSYNATSGEMESYADMDATDKVHRGIFIDGNGTGNVYGFAYETEAANGGGTTASMPEGWNLVGSNGAVNGTDSFPTTYGKDLRFSSSPAVSSDDVRIWNTNDVGSKNISTSIKTIVNYNESGVYAYESYYVYMHESSDRVIIEPEPGY